MDGWARGPGDRVDAELQRSSLECGPALSSLFFEGFMILSLFFVSWEFAVMFLDVSLFHLYDFQLGNMVSLLLRGFLVFFP